jgi:TRAP-type mannitol/chloroaromatic compound transport system permease small subunit
MGLTASARLIDRVNRSVGHVVSWLTVTMVLLQFAVVLAHYVFGLGSIFAQEAIVYMHGVLFMAAAGYTLLRDGHVRVDIFYARATPRAQSIVDLMGAIFLLIPVCILVWWSWWPYVVTSWSVLEGSRETSGIQAVYLLKSIILLFSALLGLQGLSLALKSVLSLTGQPMPTEDEHADGAV